MSCSPPPAAIRVRTRRLLGAVTALTVFGTSAVLTTIPAHADTAVSAKSGTFTIRGRLGHVPVRGVWRSSKRVVLETDPGVLLPGHQLSKLPSGTKIKVWITADNDNSLRVLPASGLTVSDTAGHRYTVPTAAKYKSLAHQSLRRRLPAQLPDEQRKLCDEVV